MLYIKRSRLKTLLGGWMGGRESRVKDCLQQSKNSLIAKFLNILLKCSFVLSAKDKIKIQ
jgi:hypothetical protein